MIKRKIVIFKIFDEKKLDFWSFFSTSEESEKNYLFKSEFHYKIFFDGCKNITRDASRFFLHRLENSGFIFRHCLIEYSTGDACPDNVLGS